MSTEKRLEYFLDRKLIIKIEPYALAPKIPITIKTRKEGTSVVYVLEMGTIMHEYATLRDAMEKAYYLTEQYYFYKR